MLLGFKDSTCHRRLGCCLFGASSSSSPASALPGILAIFLDVILSCFSESWYTRSTFGGLTDFAGENFFLGETGCGVPFADFLTSMFFLVAVLEGGTLAVHLSELTDFAGEILFFGEAGCGVSVVNFLKY